VACLYTVNLVSQSDFTCIKRGTEVEYRKTEPTDYSFAVRISDEILPSDLYIVDTDDREIFGAITKELFEKIVILSRFHEHGE